MTPTEDTERRKKTRENETTEFSEWMVHTAGSLMKTNVKTSAKNPKNQRERI